jgi:phosphohistidine swiveling domain-containing protein
MSILWLRFAQDSGLPPILKPHEKHTLEAIFSATQADSLWCRALRLLGLSSQHITEDLICWHNDTPYINWSAIVTLVSGGCLITQPNGDQFSYRYCYNITTLCRMIKAQWKISRYIQIHSEPDLSLPNDADEKLIESIALGLCILALTMRVPSKNADALNDGLVDSESLSVTFKKVIKQIKALQYRRNQLSSAWKTLFRGDETYELSIDMPAFFWDTPPIDKKPVNHSMDSEILQSHWQGIPIAGNSISARVYLVRTKADFEQIKLISERRILIFPMARPETTELFPYAAAVIYAEGGALSHAASIAREQNIPSVTGVGKRFISDIIRHLEINPDLIIHIDPMQRCVKCCGTEYL